MFLFGYENDTWMFTVFGMVGHEPPGDRAGMLSFAQDYAPAHTGWPPEKVLIHQMKRRIFHG
jgi:hypothetical protein